MEEVSCKLNGYDGDDYATDDKKDEVRSSKLTITVIKKFDK